MNTAASLSPIIILWPLHWTTKSCTIWQQRFLHRQTRSTLLHMKTHSSAPSSFSFWKAFMLKLIQHNVCGRKSLWLSLPPRTCSTWRCISQLILTTLQQLRDDSVTLLGITPQLIYYSIPTCLILLCMYLYISRLHSYWACQSAIENDRQTEFKIFSFIKAKLPVVVILAGLAKLQQGANLPTKKRCSSHGKILHYLWNIHQVLTCSESALLLCWICVPIWVLFYCVFQGASKAARRDAPAGVENC